MSTQLHEIKTNQLLKYRTKKELLQSEIAELLELGQTNDYYRWETGLRLPTLTNALKLSAALQCPIEILFIDHFNQIRKEMHQRRPKNQF